MQSRLRSGFVGGALGSIFITAIMLAMFAIGGVTPMFMSTFTATFGPSSSIVAGLAGGALFVLSGALWGVPFAALVRAPTIWKGIAFGLVPALWLWLVVAPGMLGKPVFFGFAPPKLILPFVFNCLVWGTTVGGYTAGAKEPAAS
ncbi:MAG: hypothetical protein V5A20_13340 [Salinibacter sp.]|jgi:hypothetical protein|uniref:hypothetical protein n=1 Tax=Salinibacter sp. TaxID=2065818 RepID=UPI002FC368EC